MWLNKIISSETRKKYFKYYFFKKNLIKNNTHNRHTFKNITQFNVHLNTQSFNLSLATIACTFECMHLWMHA